ncbi:MAG: hypothetical protein ACR2JB_05350 [Bryobacteraceae bacterium]
MSISINNSESVRGAAFGVGLLRALYRGAVRFLHKLMAPDFAAHLSRRLLGDVQYPFELAAYGIDFRAGGSILRAIELQQSC